MPEYEAIYTENPVKALWNWLGSLSSIETARKVLMKHPPSQPLSEEEIGDRARSLAFAVRSAREYFHSSPEINLTESCLAYYYGLLNLLEALVIASPSPPHTLKQIEAATREGHGVQNLSIPGLDFPESEVVYFRTRGFIGLYGRARSLDLDRLAPPERVSRMEDFAHPDMAINLKDLLVRIPELRKSTRQLWPKEGRCVFVSQAIRSGDKIGSLLFAETQNDTNLSVETILRIIPESHRDWFQERFDQNRQSRVIEMSVPITAANTVPKPERSALSYDYYVEPIAGKRDILLLHFLILYLLSIFVRYRPDLWRKILETDLDYFKPIIAEYLQIVERIVPHIVLNELYRIEFFFQQLTRFV